MPEITRNCVVAPLAVLQIYIYIYDMTKNVYVFIALQRQYFGMRKSFAVSSEFVCQSSSTASPAYYKTWKLY